MLYNNYLIEHTMNELVNIDYDSEYFDTLVIILYELEYKLHMVTHKAKLLTNYVRLINILYTWYNISIKVITNIVNIMNPALQDFISRHDITDSKFGYIHTKTILSALNDTNQHARKYMCDRLRIVDTNFDINFSDSIIEVGIYNVFKDIIPNVINASLEIIADEFNDKFDDVYSAMNVTTNPFDKNTDITHYNEWIALHSRINNESFDAATDEQKLDYIYSYLNIDNYNCILDGVYDYISYSYLEKIINVYINKYFKYEYENYINEQYPSYKTVLNLAVDGYAKLQKLPTAKKIDLKTFYEHGLKGNIIQFNELIKFIRNTNLFLDFATINSIINLSHNNGSMTDYIDDNSERGMFSNPKISTDYDEYYELFTNLSNGKYIPEWNADLENMGFKLNK